MKLWHVAQWGNKEEGANGFDTNCIVRAPDLKAAIALAEDHFGHRANLTWNDGRADVVYLLGEDNHPPADARIIIYLWEAPAFNNGRHESWYWDYKTNTWQDEKTMYGDLEQVDKPV